MPGRQRGRGRDGWFEAAKPIEVEGGLRARTVRGTIGEQWWSRRFIDLLEQVCDAGRLSRGRSYARKGQVLGFDLTPGRVQATVQGSRPAPYQIKINIEVYGAAAWTEIETALAAQALYRAKLLAGEMPTEIVEVFDRLGYPLFPSDLDMSCSCPDWGHPCKHLSAVLYLLAEAFDDDPFLVLAWRGRSKEALLGALRADATAEPVTGPLHVDEIPFDQRLTDFYTSSVSAGRLRSRLDIPATPANLLLRALEPPPVKVRHRPLIDLLRAAYRSLDNTGRPPGEG